VESFAECRLGVDFLGARVDGREADFDVLRPVRDQAPAHDLEASPKSLIRMFGPRGNPQARNLFSVIGYLQKQAGLQLHVTAGPA
jgi:hypothetical protein